MVHLEDRGELTFNRSKTTLCGNAYLFGTAILNSSICPTIPGFEVGNKGLVRKKRWDGPMGIPKCMSAKKIWTWNLSHPLKKSACVNWMVNQIFTIGTMVVVSTHLKNISQMGSFPQVSRDEGNVSKKPMGVLEGWKFSQAPLFYSKTLKAFHIP